jgi:YggT family protein
MPYFGNVITGLVLIINSVLTIYFWIVIASAILSWVNPDPYNMIVRAVRNLTEPAFSLVRRYLPFTVMGGIDLSPIVVILGIQLLKSAIVRNLIQFSHSLQDNVGGSLIL